MVQKVQSADQRINEFLQAVEKMNKRMRQIAREEANKALDNHLSDYSHEETPLSSAEREED